MSSPEDPIRKTYMEAFFPMDDKLASFGYFRVTYDRSRPRIDLPTSTQKYRLFAKANIPVAVNETINMSLTVARDGKEEYTMQYRDDHAGLRIRCDTAHGRPHIDIEWPGQKQRKTWLETPPRDYEEAINLILVNAEQNNPRIGAMYWLLPPLYSQDDRIEVLEQCKYFHGVNSPLTLVARVVSIALLNTAHDRKGQPITKNDMLAIFDAECRKLAAIERSTGEIPNISVNYSDKVAPFPFTFMSPPGSYRTFGEYPPTGRNMSERFVGMVYSV